MPIEPEQPSRPGRIIIPGAEPDPGGAPRIVVPPGASREPEASLPEYPRLRPLVLVPISDGARQMLLVSDPLGVIPGQPVLGIDALPLLQLLDGSVSLADLTAVLMRESKDLRVANMVKDFVAQLDQLLMLESPRFEEAYGALRETYHQLEVRPAVHEGRSYPAQPTACAHAIDEWFAAAEAMRDQAGEPHAAAGAVPRALLAPHLDPRRAGPAIARAWLEVGVTPSQPLRVVVIGTGHTLMDDLFALTRKQFETPCGKVACDTAFVDGVAKRLGDAAWHGELAHRDEHSIEFQAVVMAHRFGSKVKLVPILCGGFHALLDAGQTPRDSAAFEALIAAVRDTEAELGGTTVYVASVDFSHVGPRFGDPALDDRTREEVEGRDRAAIEAARRGDAEAWFESIASHDDATRICGFAPTYAMLRCAAPAEGRLLRYEPSDEPDGSRVTIASMVWP